MLQKTNRFVLGNGFGSCAMTSAEIHIFEYIHIYIYMHMFYKKKKLHIIYIYICAHKIIQAGLQTKFRAC